MKGVGGEGGGRREDGREENEGRERMAGRGGKRIE